MLFPVEAGETSTQNIIEIIPIQPEVVAIDAWRRSNIPIMMDISKIKPKIPEEVAKTLDGLQTLAKKGQF